MRRIHGRQTAEPHYASGLGVQAVAILLRLFVHETAAVRGRDTATLRCGVRYTARAFRWTGERSTGAVSNAVSDSLARLAGRGLVERIRMNEAGPTTHAKLTDTGRHIAECLFRTAFGEHWGRLDFADAVYHGMEAERIGEFTVYSPERPKLECRVCGRLFVQAVHNQACCCGACAIEAGREYSRNYARARAKR